MSKVRSYLKILGIMVLSTLFLALPESNLQPIICIILAVLYVRRKRNR